MSYEVRPRQGSELVTTADLWSEQYDRELMDIFALQDEISQAIEAALQMKLSPEF